METVAELFRGGAFDPEAVDVLCAAFEKARKSLHDTGQPALVQEVIARRIIALAERGQRDPDKLCEDALSSLGLKAVFVR
jgi:hypothetical protein